MIPSKQSTTKSESASTQRQDCAEESELRRNDDWISTKEDEKQEQGIRIDK